METFAKKHNARVKWIYLEVGHGKGIPDGIGATAKRAIADCITAHPGNPMYDVKTLLEFGLDDMLPSISVLHHTKKMIEEVKDMVPINIVPAPDTLKIHEVNATPTGMLTLKHTSADEGVLFSIYTTSEKKILRKCNEKVSINQNIFAYRGESSNQKL